MKKIHQANGGLPARVHYRAGLVGILLAIASLLNLTSTARAALSYNDGDIFLGFRVSGATADSYLVNLGSDTQFTLNLALNFGGSSSIGADLAALYGAAWYDRTDLSWGIFGANDANGITLYASRARTDVNTQVTPWTALSYTARGNTETKINAVRNGFIGTGYTTTQLTGNAGSQAGTAANSYYAAVNSNPDFGTSSGWSGIEGSSASGIDATVLDLVQVGQSGVSSSSVLGKFTIADDGTLSYINVAAVPEPSTYAFVGSGLAVLSFWQRSRRAGINKA